MAAGAGLNGCSLSMGSRPRIDELVKPSGASPHLLHSRKALPRPAECAHRLAPRVAQHEREK